MQAELQRTSQLAGLKGDPTAPLVQALSMALGVQARLNEQAISIQRDASQRLDRQLEATLAQGEQDLALRRTAIMANLAPDLAKLVTKSVTAWSRSVTLRTALTFGGFAVALALGVGAAGYGAGWRDGRDGTRVTAGALVGALAQAGPSAETALVDMVRANNVPDAWAECQKSAIADKDGRRVCLMPMWADQEIQPKR